jgi:hypothetical protein
VAGQWLSPGTPLSSTNKKVELNTINLNLKPGLYRTIKKL